MTPHAIVEIDGVRKDSWLNEELFQRVSVELATGEASQAVVQLFDPDFLFIDKYAGIASPTGTMPVMKVWLGFGQDLGQPVYKGLIARVERGEASTTFRAYDMSYRMRLQKKAEYHKGGDLEIIERLARRNGLLFQGPAKPLKLEPHKAMAQDEQTDWEHAAQLAHDAGLLLWTRQDTLFADYPAKVGVPKVTLRYKKDFTVLRNFDLAFKVPENKEGRPKGIEVRGRGRGGKRLKGSSDEDQRGHEILRVKRDLAIHTKAYATARAQAQKELDREHAFQCSISAMSLLPRTRIDVRDTLSLVGLSKLFSGEYVVDRATHELTPGHLNTQFELYRDIKQ